MNKNEILILDIETTGFQNQGGLIIEIGMVRLNLLNGHIEPEFDSLCKEQTFDESHKDAWIFKNSDLTFDEVENATPFQIVKGKLQNILYDSKIGCTAYNNRFDFNFLESRGIDIPFKLDCPMLISTNICKLENRNGYSGYKWPSVEEAYQHFFPDEKYIEKHRGFDDSVHEAKIVYELSKLGFYK